MGLEAPRGVGATGAGGCRSEAEQGRGQNENRVLQSETVFPEDNCQADSEDLRSRPPKRGSKERFRRQTRKPCLIWGPQGVFARVESGPADRAQPVDVIC